MAPNSLKVEDLAVPNWDKTTPTIPVFGTNEINDAPYTVPPERTTKYDRLRRTRERERSLRAWGKLGHLWATITDKVSGDMNHIVQGLTEDDLKAIAVADYPLPSETRVDVMDFSPERCELSRPKFGAISQWKYKPDWATIRWIHVPFGRSWVGTFCEDEILIGGPRGFPFSNTGTVNFPYVSVPTTSFLSRAAYDRQRDVFSYFSRGREGRENATLANISCDLKACMWSNPELQVAINEYKGQRGRRPKDYWSQAFAQMPLDVDEVTDSNRQSDSLFGHRRRNDELPHQILARHPYYSGSHFVQSTIRTYHRSDGFVLTMSPPLGIQYLHRDWFKPSVQASTSHYPENTWGALVPQAFYHLSKGVKNWYRLDENWLVIYIMTEACMMPSSRLGGPGLSPEEGYFIILQQLKQRRRDDWNSAEAVSLVSDLVNLNDELHSWKNQLDSQVELLSWLRKDAILLESYYKANPCSDQLQGTVAGPVARVDHTVRVVKKRQAEFQTIFDESNRVLEAVFRLRTIQQNELANSADRSNKTILVFTIVSLIFLPLTFLSSYFSMLEDLMAEPRTTGSTAPAAESETGTVTTFWVVGAPFTVGIGLFALAAAFRGNLLKGIRLVMGVRVNKEMYDPSNNMT